MYNNDIYSLALDAASIDRICDGSCLDDILDRFDHAENHAATRFFYGPSTMPKATTPRLPQFSGIALTSSHNGARHHA